MLFDTSLTLVKVIFSFLNLVNGLVAELELLYAVATVSYLNVVGLNPEVWVATRMIWSFVQPFCFKLDITLFA